MIDPCGTTSALKKSSIWRSPQLSENSKFGMWTSALKKGNVVRALFDVFVFVLIFVLFFGGSECEIRIQRKTSCILILWMMPLVFFHWDFIFESLCALFSMHLLHDVGVKF